MHCSIGMCLFIFFGAAGIVCEAVSVQLSGVRPSVPFAGCTPLLRVCCCMPDGQETLIDAAAATRRVADSVTLSADVGSRTQTCYNYFWSSVMAVPTTICLNRLLLWVSVNVLIHSQYVCSCWSDSASRKTVLLHRPRRRRREAVVWCLSVCLSVFFQTLTWYKVNTVLIN